MATDRQRKVEFLWLRALVFIFVGAIVLSVTGCRKAGPDDGRVIEDIKSKLIAESGVCAIGSNTRTIGEVRVVGRRTEGPQILIQATARGSEIGPCRGMFETSTGPERAWEVEARYQQFGEDWRIGSFEVRRTEAPPTPDPKPEATESSEQAAPTAPAVSNSPASRSPTGGDLPTVGARLGGPPPAGGTELHGAIGPLSCRHRLKVKDGRVVRVHTTCRSRLDEMEDSQVATEQEWRPFVQALVGVFGPTEQHDEEAHVATWKGASFEAEARWTVEGGFPDPPTYYVTARTTGPAPAAPAARAGGGSAADGRDTPTAVIRTFLGAYDRKDAATIARIWCRRGGQISDEQISEGIGQWLFDDQSKDYQSGRAVVRGIRAADLSTIRVDGDDARLAIRWNNPKRGGGDEQIDDTKLKREATGWCIYELE